MPSIFDGMASILNDVLGDPVIYQPKGSGGVHTIHSTFRDMPVEAVDEDSHPVLIVSPSWWVPRSHHLASGIRRDDEIKAPNGKFYKVLNAMPSGSTADDAFIVCELERVFPK